jgi:hypothetical protein
MREENNVSDLNSGNVRMRERNKTVYSQYRVRALFLSDQLFTIPKYIMMRLQNADDSSQPIFWTWLQGVALKPTVEELVLLN